MVNPATSTVTELFKMWRSGDEEAGQRMAQQVSDWYFAVCTSRYGEEKGTAVFQKVSQKFGTGIVSVSHSTDLVDWAYGLLADEINEGNLTPSQTNSPSPYSGGHTPLDLLSAARSALPAEVQLVDAFFSRDEGADIDALAINLGGMPGALLHARYSIKRWLFNEYKLPFEVVPLEPDIDLFPLPMYEADRLGNLDEVATFEKWMLDNKALCRDVAEFGPFTNALRLGLPKAKSNQAQGSEKMNHSFGQRVQISFINVVLFIGILLILTSVFAFTFSLFMSP